MDSSVPVIITKIIVIPMETKSTECQSQGPHQRPLSSSVSDQVARVPSRRGCRRAVPWWGSGTEVGVEAVSGQFILPRLELSCNLLSPLVAALRESRRMKVEQMWLHLNDYEVYLLRRPTFRAIGQTRLNRRIWRKTVSVSRTVCSFEKR